MEYTKQDGEFYKINEIYGRLMTGQILTTNNVVEFITKEEYELATGEVVENLVPETLSAIKLFTQLLIEGITEANIKATVDYLVSVEQLDFLSGEMAKIALQKATEFDRDNPFITLIGLAFGKTEYELDEIFIKANEK